MTTDFPTRIRPTRIRNAAFCAALISGLAVMPAFAGMQVIDKSLDRDQISISIDSQYFATDRGLKKIYKALKKEADQACDRTNGRISLTERQSIKVCRAEMLDAFVASANHNGLTQMHRRTKER